MPCDLSVCLQPQHSRSREVPQGSNFDCRKRDLRITRHRFGKSGFEHLRILIWDLTNPSRIFSWIPKYRIRINPESLKKWDLIRIRGSRIRFGLNTTLLDWRKVMYPLILTSIYCAPTSPFAALYALIHLPRARALWLAQRCGLDWS